MKEKEDEEYIGNIGINDDEEIEVENSSDIFKDKKDSFNKEEEEEKKEKLIDLNDNINSINDDDQNEREKFVNHNFEELQHLISVLQDVEKELRENEENKSIDEVYEKYLDNLFINKSNIKNDIKSGILKLMIFFIGPLFGIIFLIGIFQVKSIMNALANLVKDSSISYYKCKFHSNCNITISDGETSVYDFYNYYYNYTMNETINFNLTMITALIGGILLKLLDFIITTLLLCIPNVGAIFWLADFDFYLKDNRVFDYDFLKIINLIIIYILLLCGIGGSALLSQQILIEGHLKYKEYLLKIFFKKKNEKQDKKIINVEDFLKDDEQIIDKHRTRVFDKNNLSHIFAKNLPNQNEPFSPLNTLKIRKDSKDLFLNLKDKKEKKLDEKLKRRMNNKFDYFFMICLITIIGYLGKFGMNIILDMFLTNIYGKKYDKKYFFIYILILYGISIASSIAFYLIYKNCVFKNIIKKKKKKKLLKSMKYVDI